MTPWTFWLLPALMWAAAVPAAQAQAGAADCVALADASERLACYDRLHGRVATLPPAPVPAAAAAPASAPAETPVSASDGDSVRSHLGWRWDLDGQQATLFAPRAYRPVYLLPATWADRVNQRPGSPSPEHSVPADLGLRSAEVKYQLSLKAKLGDQLFGTPLSLWGGYTQSSRWQVYNGALSRPFRETNYEPELMMVWPLQAEVLGWQVRMASLSLNHQSNGRSLPLSRSWNRVIATLAAERDDWMLELRPWLRLRESAGSDDNADITDYMGRGELRLTHFRERHAFALQLRHSLRGGSASRGSVELDWVFPLAGALHGYLQVFSGYGESLIDYNFRQTKVGLGITIAGWR